MKEAFQDRTISGSGTIISGDIFVAYEAAARRFEGIQISLSTHRKDDLGNPLGENEVRIIIQGKQNHPDFRQAVSAEIEILKLQVPDIAGE